MNIAKRICKKCSSSNLKTRGTQLICLVCGNAEQGSHVFQTEYQHTQMRRTTKYIKEKQTRDFTLKHRQPIQNHLEENWGQYLLGFQRYLFNLAEIAQSLFQLSDQYTVKVKEVWFDYMNQWTRYGQPLRSNWTIARKGHQQPLKISRYIPTKYGRAQDYDIFEMIEQTTTNKLEFTPKEKNLLSTADQVVSTFDLDQIQNFESQQQSPSVSQSGRQSHSVSQSGNDVVTRKKRVKKTKKIPQEQKKKRLPTKKEKSYFYVRRTLKKQIIEGRKETESQGRRRGSISKRKSSVTCNELQQFVDIHSSNLKNHKKWDYLKTALRQKVEFTDLEYATIIEVYFDNSMQNSHHSDMIGSIKKIKNITSLSTKSDKLLLQVGFSKSEAECLSPYYQKEAYLLRDFLAIMTNFESVEKTFQTLYNSPRIVIDISYSHSSIIYLTQKADQLMEYILKVTKRIEERKSLNTALSKVKDKQFKPQPSPPTIDFYLIPVILLEASFNVDSPILPRDLYASMRQGTLPFMKGFQSQIEDCRSYLTAPTNYPSPKYIRSIIQQRVITNQVPFYVVQIANLLNFDNPTLQQALEIDVLIKGKIKYKMNQQDQYSLALLLVSFQLQFWGISDATKLIELHLHKLIFDEMERMVPLHYRELKYKSYDQLICDLQIQATEQEDTFLNNRKFEQMNAYFEKIEGEDKKQDSQKERAQSFQTFPIQCSLIYLVGDNQIFQGYLEKLQEYFYEDMDQVLVFKKLIELSLIQ